MKKFTHSALTLAAGLFLSVPLVRAADPFGAQQPIHVGGAGRWDYATFDPAGHLLYVTRSTHSQAIDPATGKVVLDVQGQERSHGIVAVDTVGRGYITDGKAGAIVAFDLKTGAVLATVPAAAERC